MIAIVSNALIIRMYRVNEVLEILYDILAFNPISCA